MAEPMTFGDYEVVRPLSQGGMGDVFLARKRGAHGFEKHVALKTLRAELAGEASYRAAFNDEARLVSRLTHPRIGQVYDFGEHDGALFIVMEYVEGVSLNVLLRELVRLPLRTAVELVIEVARALHYAHVAVGDDGKRLGVVHRDVSPHNIMLTPNGDVKLIDFGIALMRNRQTPRTEQGIKGKVGYMAPEQLRGEAVDARADVFALSIVLYEAISGAPLFNQENVALAVTAVLESEVPALTRVVPGAPGALDVIAAKGLARVASDRFASAAELADALSSLTDLPGPTLAAFAAEHVPRFMATTDRPVRGVTRTATRPGAVEPSETPLADPPAPARERRRSTRRVVVALAALVLAVGLGASVVRLRAPANESLAPPPPVELAEPTPPRAEAPPPSVATPAAPPASTVSTLADKQRGKRPPRGSRIAAAPQKTAPQGIGYVSFAAEPYAHVRVDGREVGVTPLLRQPLPAGPHDIELVDPETSRVRLKKRLTVEVGMETWASAR